MADQLLRHVTRKAVTRLVLHVSILVTVRYNVHPQK